MMIFFFPNQGASSSASGTRVVLPAPGGATSTAELLCSSARVNSSSAASMGRGGEKRLDATPPHAFIRKTERCHFLRPIDISQINDDRLRHLALQALQIERAELHPLGDDHQGIGAAHAGIGI